MSSLEAKTRTLEQEWDSIQDPLGYPNLKMPEIKKENETGISTAAIDMKTKEIFITEEFVDDLETKIRLDNAMRGISAHEANHYVTLPFNLKNMLLLEHEISKVDKKNKHLIGNYFFDVVINLDLMDRGIREIADVYKGMDSGHVVDETLKALYTGKTKTDFGVRDKNNVDMNALTELAKIDYSNLKMRKLRTNAKRFAKIISPLLKQDFDNMKREKADAESKGQKYSPKPFGIIDDIDVDSFGEKDLYKAVKDIAEDVTPEEYKDIIKDLTPQLPGKGMSKGSGDEKFRMPTISYYERLSEKYEIKVKEKNTVTGTEQMPDQYREWEPGTPLKGIDIFKSRGKIMPGTTKEKVYRDEPITQIEQNNHEGIPDALIIIDSSASMPDPRSIRSYAVLGGFCAANYYLERGKETGILNFSSTTKKTDYTTNKQKAYEAIARYQQGGTVTELDKIRNMVNKKESLDIYLITDMFITNGEETIKYFAGLDENYRTNIFLIGTHGNPVKHKNIQVHPITSEESIPSIIIEDLNQNYKEKGVEREWI